MFAGILTRGRHAGVWLSGFPRSKATSPVNQITNISIDKVLCTEVMSVLHVTCLIRQ